MENDLAMGSTNQALLDISTSGSYLQVVDLRPAVGGVYFAILVQGDSISDSASSTLWSSVSVTASRTSLVVGELASGLSPSWARVAPTLDANVTKARLAVASDAVYYVVDLDRDGVVTPAAGAFSRSGSEDSADVDLTEFSDRVGEEVVGADVATLSDSTARVVIATQFGASTVYCLRASLDLATIESADVDPSAGMVAATVLPIGGNAHLLVAGADSNSELFLALPLHEPSSLGSFSLLRGEFLAEVTSLTDVPLLDDHVAVGGSSDGVNPTYVVASINTGLTSVTQAYLPTDPTAGADVSSFPLVVGIHSKAHDVRGATEEGRPPTPMPPPPPADALYPLAVAADFLHSRRPHHHDAGRRGGSVHHLSAGHHEGRWGVPVLRRRLLRRRVLRRVHSVRGGQVFVLRAVHLVHAVPAGLGKLPHRTDWLRRVR